MEVKQNVKKFALQKLPVLNLAGFFMDFWMLNVIMASRR